MVMHHKIHKFKYSILNLLMADRHTFKEDIPYILSKTMI